LAGLHPRSRNILLSPFISKASRRVSSFFLRVQLSQPYVAKNEETRLDAFEMKGLIRMLRVSWTAKKTNEWVLNKAGVKRELLDTVKARKL